MSMMHALTHMVNHAAHAKGSDAKWAGVILIVVGFFFTPILIGIPIMIFGIVKLVQGFGNP